MHVSDLLSLHSHLYTTLFFLFIDIFLIHMLHLSTIISSHSFIIHMFHSFTTHTSHLSIIHVLHLCIALIYLYIVLNYFSSFIFISDLCTAFDHYLYTTFMHYSYIKLIHCSCITLIFSSVYQPSNLDTL